MVLTENTNTTTPEDKGFNCEECGKKTNDEHEHDNYYYCEDCYNDKFVCCVNCNEVFDKNNCRYSDNGDCYCDDCYNDKFIGCECCGCEVNNDYINSFENCYYCDNCYNNRVGYCDSCDRNYWLNDGCGCDGCGCDEITNPFKKIKSKTFKDNRFKDFCGYEIECYYNDSDDLFDREVLNKYDINSQIGDSSLNHKGIEFNSQALNGDVLYNSINGFCDELRNKEFSVDKKCGLHIHIQINKRCEELKKIVLFYKKFEDYFYKMVSHSRRDNFYCRRIGDVYNFSNNEDDVLNIKNNTTLKKLVYETKRYNTIKRCTKEKYNNKRYSWLNLHSVFYRGTLEFRLHNGTTDKTKIKNWFKIHLTILEFLRGIKNPETIKHLPLNEEFFLSLFDKDLKDYIKNRWEVFKNSEVEGC